MPDNLTKLLSDAVEAPHRLPCAAAMAAHEKGVLFEYAGASEPSGIDCNSIFWLASMSKAVTATAALQLVERGVLTLDTPAGDWVPELAAPVILEGFGDNGPILRPARQAITLRDLLAHTSGHGYAFGSDALGRYVKQAGLPPRSSGTRASYNLPLLFEPGSDWHYGIGVDWAGAVIEAASGQPLDTYLEEHVLAPLGMADTGFTLDTAQAARRAPMSRRDEDGRLEPMTMLAPTTRPEFVSGGGGLYGTPRDFLCFLRMLAGGGVFEGRRILAPESVQTMQQNQIGNYRGGWITSAQPRITRDFDLLPGMAQKWGLGFAINPERSAEGRSAASVGWAGLANSYYWIDRARASCGLFMTQILPFADPEALALFRRFETTINTRLDGCADS
ncbi:serine hydrolase domain-containing protein [Salinisphaera aquimarina]|uniref:Serine hydrolase domain-containing protein n=1 Tax=Salinisphaera aquimarina TaxID=2094031 RepID=A0ABV7EPC9_9GAMM